MYANDLNKPIIFFSVSFKALFAFCFYFTHTLWTFFIIISTSLRCHCRDNSIHKVDQTRKIYIDPYIKKIFCRSRMQLCPIFSCIKLLRFGYTISSTKKSVLSLSFIYIYWKNLCHLVTVIMYSSSYTTCFKWIANFCINIKFLALSCIKRRDMFRHTFFW